MRPSLPVEGISLILGNDLAGEKVMVDPRVVEESRNDEKMERLAEKFPGIFPASVCFLFKCSMKAKKEAIKEEGKEDIALSVKEDIALSVTFPENIEGKFKERNKVKAEKKGNIPDNNFFTMTTDSHTRGHKFKIQKQRSRLNIRKYFFTNRIVDSWNSLPECIIEVETVDAFKNRLENFYDNNPKKYVPTFMQY